MFKCMECKQVSKPREKAYKKVLKTRDVTYKLDEHVYSKGTEIVEEIQVCGKCKEKEA